MAGKGRTIYILTEQLGEGNESINHGVFYSWDDAEKAITTIKQARLEGNVHLDWECTPTGDFALEQHHMSDISTLEK